MNKPPSISIKAFVALGACITIWCGVITFLGEQHNKELDKVEEGEIWMGQDLVAPFDYNVPRPPPDIALEVEKIYRDNPVALYFDGVTVIEEQKMQFKIDLNEVFEEERSKYLPRQNGQNDSSDLVDPTVTHEQNNSTYEDALELDLAIVVNFGEEYIERYYKDNPMVLNADSIMQKGLFYRYKEEKFSRTQLLSRSSLEELSDFYTVPLVFANERWQENFSDFTKDRPWVENVLQKALPKHPRSTLDLLKFSGEVTRRTMKIDSAIQAIDTVQTHYKRGDLIVAQGEKVRPEQVQAISTLEADAQNNFLSEEELLQINLAKFLLMVIILLGVGAVTNRVATNGEGALRYSLVTISLIGMFVVFVVFAERYVPGHVAIVPMAIAPIIVMAFFNRETALVVLLATAGLSSLVVSDAWSFMTRHILVGVGVLYYIKSIRYWSDFLRLSLIVLSLNACFDVVHFLMRGADVDTRVLWLFANIGIQSFLTFLALPFILLFERLYGALSELRLVELSDINKPLLKGLSINTPGTFQHSLQVANLAEYAAERVGADSLLIKTGALYHDIGKMQEPEYFIENQAPGQNPHDLLNASESAKKIIDHVSHGVTLAREYGLPNAIQRFILTHHGDSRVEYFYQTSLRDDETTREIDFKYPGPKPQTKEEAILMMADAAEASSKSLKVPDESSISDMVDKVIDKQMQEGQLGQADISLCEINQCKAAFKERLNNIHHIRISYPPEAKEA